MRLYKVLALLQGLDEIRGKKNVAASSRENVWWAKRYRCLKMTGAGTHTMISRVVIVRHLGGLLCATVGPMVSLLNFFSLHPWES